MKRVAAGLFFAAAVFGSACAEPEIDCAALCARTLACDVAFVPSDDPDEALIASGERTEAESCALGCEESPVVTVEHAACADGVAITEDEVCQDALLTCFELPLE